MQQAIQQQFGIGLHQSLWSQYVSYWSQLFHGNLGQSITLSAPVSTVLGQTLPWTVGLVGAATVISFVLGTLPGSRSAGGAAPGWTGCCRCPRSSRRCRTSSSALSLLLVAGQHLRWFPVLGGYDRGS